MGDVSWGPGPGIKEVATTTPRFSSLGPDDLAMPPSEDAHWPGAMTLLDLSVLELLEMTISHTQAMGEVHYHPWVWSFTRMSLLSAPSQRQLEPSPKAQRTLSNYNSPLHHGNTCAKHWPKQIPAVLIKWISDQVNTHSPHEVNFRIEWIPALNQRKSFKWIN